MMPRAGVPQSVRVADHDDRLADEEVAALGQFYRFQGKLGQTFQQGQVLLRTTEINSAG